MECVKPILEFLVGHLMDLSALEENIHSLTETMKTLKGERDDMLPAVIAAERQGLQRTSRVKNWLGSVQDLEEASSKIDTEFQTMFKCCGNYPLNVFSGCHLSRNAKQKLEEVRNLITSGNFNVIADDMSTICTREMPTTSSLGLDKMLDEMLSQLDSFIRGTEVGIVGIYGMGGVGKTTLLNRFNNKLRTVAHDFELVLPIVVTEKVDVEKIQRMIASRLRFNWKENADVEERADDILQALSKMNFVIILDDVWEPLNLSSLGIPIPSGPPYLSKIVVASRVEDVCTRMEAQQRIKVECLRWDEAWSLFLEKAGRELITSHTGIERYAKAIVRKCGGLPLALTTIGLAMAAKSSELEWRYALRALDNMPADVQGMERDVLRSLKRSYDNLPDDRLRLCFLYFILYKETSWIHANEPVDYWIGEAIINEFDDICEASVEGLDIICRLKVASLLESVDGHHVRMHGMIYSMAKWVACECGRERNKWLVQRGLQLSEAPELERWRAAERISLADNYISGISGGVPDCPRLVSLMLNDNSLLRSFPNGFFLFMPSLRVLDLSNTSVEEVPPEIGMLVELQFLNLSRTKLRMVPSELGNLGKLRYLDLSWNSHLTMFPEGVIKGLSAELRVLRMFETFGSWMTDAANVDSGRVCFEELEGLRRLKMLMITVETAEALHRLSESNRLALPTHLLHLRDLQGTTTINLPSDLGSNMKKLGELSINDSSDLKEVIVDDSRWGSFLPQFKHLRFVSLLNASITFKLGPSECMRGLSKLEIHGCPKVEQLIGEVVETGSQDSMEARIAFPGLQILYLIDLPELKSICRSMLILPSLRRLKVEKCPKLRRLPFGPHSCRELKEIHGRLEWWDELEWDDDATRAFFFPLFSLPPCGCLHIHR